MVYFVSLQLIAEPLTRPLTIGRQTVEDYGIVSSTSWRLCAVLFGGVVALAIYHWQTGQVREVTGWWPYVIMALVVWLPNFYARGTIGR